MSVPLSVYATVALAGGVVLFYRAFRDFRIRQLIENTPTSRIRSMAMGLAEVEGEVVPRSGHVAPFSGKPCAYWEVDIATQARRNQWSVVHRASSGNPFFLRDETGLALVYPQGAKCRVRNQVEETCLGVNLPDCYAEYMNEHKLSFSLVWRLGVLRFRERTLEEGQRVYILGTAMPRPNVLDISQDAALQATGTDGLHQREVQSLSQQVSAVIRRGESERVFIISQDSQRELSFGLGLAVWGQMIAGPLLTLFGLGYWLTALASRGRFPG